MASRIVDDAFLPDVRGAATVLRDGSVDGSCLPRFDSAACMVALVDGEGKRAT